MSRRGETLPERAEMEAVIEAILFVSNDPVPREKLIEVFGARAEEQALEALGAVVERYGGGGEGEGGIVIDRAGGGYRLVSRPDLHGYLRRFFEVTGSNKLSMPALETLAIVAYRQPVTAPEISELRGVSSQGVLKKLLERRLVRITGRKEVVGKPFLYATTRDFLMHFGLRTLAELPPLEQFEELFGSGDPEASADEPPDLEEQAQLEEIEVAEADDERAEKEAELQDERQQREAEALELQPGASPPEGPGADSSDAQPADTDRMPAPGDEREGRGPISPAAAASREREPSEAQTREEIQEKDHGG
ncbi:MAG: SMC-Scp complex subunit ScpB [Acidobacteriota bacterium]